MVHRGPTRDTWSMRRLHATPKIQGRLARDCYTFFEGDSRSSFFSVLSVFFSTSLTSQELSHQDQLKTQPQPTTDRNTAKTTTKSDFEPLHFLHDDSSHVPRPGESGHQPRACSKSRRFPPGLFKALWKASYGDQGERKDFVKKKTWNRREHKCWFLKCSLRTSALVILTWNGYLDLIYRSGRSRRHAAPDFSRHGMRLCSITSWLARVLRLSTLCLPMETKTWPLRTYIIALLFRFNYTWDFFNGLACKHERGKEETATWIFKASFTANVLTFVASPFCF